MTIQEVLEKIHLINSPYQGKRNVLGTYLINTEKKAIIDPGPTTQTPGVIKALKAKMIKRLDYVLLTHIHLDHAGGSWRILDKYPTASVHLHPKGIQHMVDPSRLEAGARGIFGGKVNEYGEIKGIPTESLLESNDGEELEIGNTLLKVIWTPGHSSHHQAYFEPKDRVLFVGDAGGRVFSTNGGIIPTSPVPYNPVSAVESIDKLIKHNPKIIGYSHFGFYEEATCRLNEFKAQTLLWTKVTAECVEEGIGFSDITNRLQEVDVNVKKVIESGLEIETNLLQSIGGFVEYAKWIRGKRK